MSTGSRSERRAAQEAAQAAAREGRRADLGRTVRRFRWPALAAVLLIVAAVAFVALRGEDPAPAASPSGRAETTVLIQVVPQLGQPAVGTSLTAADSAAGRATFLPLPGRLITEVPGRGSSTLEQTSVTADGSTAVAAVSDQLGVIVDGSWVLTGPTWAGLIDKVGGVTVDVDVDVEALENGSRVVSVPQGSARPLGGVQAVAYATYLAPSETESARMARFAAVWGGFLAELPGDEDAVRNLVAGNAGSVSSLSPDQLAAFLLTLRTAVGSDSVSYPSVPTVSINTGTGPLTYRIDGAKVADLVGAQFPGSLRPTPPGGPVTVLVQDGVGSPGAAAKARTKLLAADLTYKAGGSAERSDYATTVIYISDDAPAARSKGQAVATALGVPASAVRVSTEGQSVADVLVILGADFQG